MLGAVKRSGVFRSLRVRNCRLFFTGHIVSVCGTWMQRVAQDWLVLTLTDSGVALGVTMAMQFGPTLLFGLWGGSLIDRFDRRKLVIATQIAQAVLALALGLLTVTGVVTIAMVYGIAFGLGVVTVIDAPARHTFIADLVGSEDFVNAQSLNGSVHNTGRLVGPAFAGLVIGSFGVGTAFLINAGSFIAVLFSLFMMNPAELNPRPPVSRKESRARDGLRYVWRDSELRACMVIVLVVAMLGQNFSVVLPLLTSKTFGAGASTYGYMTAALGLGAVAGALVNASRKTVTSRTILAMAVLFGAANIAAAVMPSLLWVYVALVALGAANISFKTNGRTLILLNGDASMHGRLLALYSFIVLGSTPIGGPLMGWICEVVGARGGLAVAGGSAVLTAALFARPLLRRVSPAVEMRPVEENTSPA